MRIKGERVVPAPVRGTARQPRRASDGRGFGTAVKAIAAFGGQPEYPGPGQ